MTDFNFLHIASLFIGFWWGSFITGLAYKKAHQRFIDELHKQYVKSLDKMKEKFARECRTSC